MEGMTIRQLRELELFYSIEPFGEYRQELRHGQSQSLLANINRDSKSTPEAYKPLDFMNFVEKPPERIYTMEELEAYATRIFGV